MTGSNTGYDSPQLKVSESETDYRNPRLEVNGAETKYNRPADRGWSSRDRLQQHEVGGAVTDYSIPRLEEPITMAYFWGWR